MKIKPLFEYIKQYIELALKKTTFSQKSKSGNT